MENLPHSLHPNKLPKKPAHAPKAIYDDVFGGPPRYGGVPTLSPRAEDYGEIFGGFHAPRALAIPVLDLPAAGEAGAFFDVRSPGFDYSEVFGGYGGLDFADGREVLVRQSNGGDGGSSDEAWTPSASDYLSEESDHSGSNQYFSNGDPYNSVDADVEYNMSYHKANIRSNSETSNGIRHANQIHAVSGFSYLVDQRSAMPYQEYSGPSSWQTCDDNPDVNFCRERMKGKGKHLRKTVSQPSNTDNYRETYENDMRPQREYGRMDSCPNKPFVTISEISLRTEPSHLPPPSRPPPAFDFKIGDASGLASSWKEMSPEGSEGDGSPHFFDVEVDASSSAAVASAAAMKEAMDKAQARLRSARDLMQRKKEGVRRTKLGSHKDSKDTIVKVRSKVADEMHSRKVERVQATNQRDSGEMQSYITRNVMEPNQGTSDENISKRRGKELSSSRMFGNSEEAAGWKEATLLSEMTGIDRSGGAHERTNRERVLEYANNHGSGQIGKKAGVEAFETQESSRKMKVVREAYRGKEFDDSGRRMGNKEKPTAAKQVLRQKDHERKDKVIEGFVQSEGIEKKHKIASHQTETCSRPENAQYMKKHESMGKVLGEVNNIDVRKGVQRGQDGKNLEKVSPSFGSEELKESYKIREQIYDWEERRPGIAIEQEKIQHGRRMTLGNENTEKNLEGDLKWTENGQKKEDTAEEEEKKRRLQEVSEREEEEKKLNKLQELKDKEKLKEAQEKEESERRLRVADEQEEKNRRLREAHEREENGRRQKEILEKEEERRLREGREREENERRRKEILEKEEKERRLREAREREGNERRQKEILEKEEKERTLREAREREENERRRKEILEKEEKERTLREAREREENERRRKEILENEEKERRLREAREREENERRRKEILEKEEKERRLREACEREEKEKERRQNEILEKEEKERRLREAREREEKEKERRQNEILEKEEKERRLREACEREENEKERRQKEILKKEEKDRRLREACGQQENERRQKEILEKEEKDRRLREAREQEEIERKFRESLEKEEKGKMLREALEVEEREEKVKEDHEIDEDEKRLAEVRQQQDSGKMLKPACGRGAAEKVFDKSQANEENEKCIEKAAGFAENHEVLMGVEKNEEMKAAFDKGSEPEEMDNAFKDNIEFEVINDRLHEVSDIGELSSLTQDYKIAQKDQACWQNSTDKIQADTVPGECDENLETSTTTEASTQGNKVPTNESGSEKKPLAVEITKMTDEDGKFSGVAQAGLKNREDVSKMDNIRASQPLDNRDKTTSATFAGVEQMDVEASGRVSRDSCNTSYNERKSVHEKGERKDNIKQNRVPLHQNEKKDKFTSTQVMKEGFDMGKKTETSQPDLLNPQKTGKQHSAPHIGVGIEKIVNRATRAESTNADVLRKEQELEMERLRKLEEEREREREREKDSMAVDRATLEARERVLSEAHERAERAALERATTEARQRAMMEARERLEKACAEARERTFTEKSSSEARFRAAMERATAEARERAAERAMAEKATSDKFSTSRYNGMRESSQSLDPRDTQNQSAGCSINSRYASSSGYSGSHDGERPEVVEGESTQRCRARLERHRRTAERAAKALAEKNMRDLVTQREQAERNRLAETLDADVKRWSSSKEGNLRALLSTLQYILGPDSGWQPIPLTEVITSAAVKRAYRKATLCVHPDKLQQRGASIQQKYICEKVFDLLKEAWNKFNSEER